MFTGYHLDYTNCSSASLATIWMTPNALVLHWLLFWQHYLLSCFTGYYFDDTNCSRASLATILTTLIALVLHWLPFLRCRIFIFEITTTPWVLFGAWNYSLGSTFRFGTTSWGLLPCLELLPGKYFWIWNNLLATAFESETTHLGIVLDLE